MDYRKLVIEEYQRAVRESPTATPELKHALKTSDRVPAFLNRLSGEIARAEMVICKRRGKLVKLETLKWAVRQMTETFLVMMENHAANQQTNSIEKQRRALAMDESLNPEKYLKDMGVITDDPTQIDEEGP